MASERIECPKSENALAQGDRTNCMKSPLVVQLDTEASVLLKTMSDNYQVSFK